jgi:hypothetical protein
MIAKTFSRIKQAGKILLGRQNPGRSLTVFPDDIFIVSYPKSGNTWTRFLLGNLIHHPKLVDFENIETMVPDIYYHNDEELQQLNRPRLLKSHEYFDPRYKKSIYIVRDPRDVAVSYYHHHVKFNLIASDHPIDAFVNGFIEGNLDAYGSWGEHVGSWLGAHKPADMFLFLRYEDLLSDTLAELRKITAFLKLDMERADLERAIERSSPQNMRKLEQAQYSASKIWRNSNKDKNFVRSARAGDWKDQLSPAAAQAIESAWRKPMELCGYIG